MGKNPAKKLAAKDNVVQSNTKEAKKKVKKTVSKKVSVKGEERAAVGRSCRVGSCKNEYRAKGYCNIHYKKWRQGEYGKTRYKTCNEHDCRDKMAMNRNGYCETHYQNYYVKGMSAPVAAPAEKPKEKESVAQAG